MTREEARTMREGAYVMSRHSSPPWRPYCLTKVFLPEKGTPMAQIAQLSPGAWVHLEAFEPCPKDKAWNRVTSSWEPHK